MLNPVKNHSGRKLFQHDGQRRKIIKEASHQLFRNALSFFSNQ
jgi:hypothetical protein